MEVSFFPLFQMLYQYLPIHLCFELQKIFAAGVLYDGACDFKDNQCSFSHLWVAWDRTYDHATGMYAHYCLQMKSTWLGRNSSCFI